MVSRYDRGRASIRQNYTCRATGATKVSFCQRERTSKVWRVLNKSIGPNKRLYYSRYLRLLISPRNPNVFFHDNLYAAILERQLRYSMLSWKQTVCIPQISNIFVTAIFIYIYFFVYCVREIIIEIMCFVEWKIFAQFISIIQNNILL